MPCGRATSFDEKLPSISWFQILVHTGSSGYIHQYVRIFWVLRSFHVLSTLTHPMIERWYVEMEPAWERSAHGERWRRRWAQQSYWKRLYSMCTTFAKKSWILSGLQLLLPFFPSSFLWDFHVLIRLFGAFSERPPIPLNEIRASDFNPSHNWRVKMLIPH